MFNTRFNLGIPQLIPQWKMMFTKQYLVSDILAGSIVACVAIPLSLAISLASGVPPEIGLITAIIGGIVCALFGGVPLAVSGPAAAMAVLVASVVDKFGISGLLFVTFTCGLLQLLTGVFGLGTIIRFVPVPVVMGFTAGIGAIILIGQFPRILGLPAADESSILGVITHINELFHQTHPTALILSMTTLSLTIALPRVWPRLPAPLLAVLIPSLIVYFYDIPVELIGKIPESLPFPTFPPLPQGMNLISELILTSFVVYALASLETLLSAGAVDQLAKSKPHDPNQELIGQGLGNTIVSFFGGIPMTAVIARSALNVQAGGKTRRSSIFHALILLATVYFLAPVMSQIPIAVLAGLLISIALRMCHPHEFLVLWRSARGDAVIYLITFVMIVLFGLLNGIQVGIIASLILAAIRLNQIKLSLITTETGPAQLSFNGHLTFLSANKIELFQKKLEGLDLSHGIIFDLIKVKALDASGATYLINLIEQLQARGVKAVLHGLDPLFVNRLIKTKPTIADLIAKNEDDVEKILGYSSQNKEQEFDRLVYGIQKFKKNLKPRHKEFFSHLAKVQKPHTLFITCCDSRIDPNLITSTHPGELFIVRNIGNVIPAFGQDDTPAEGAAIEYALTILEVKRIIVCGHSECGAMAQLISGEIFKPENAKKLPCVWKWLSELRNMQKYFHNHITNEEASKLNASLQIENVKTYPIVQEKLAKNELKLQAWYYNIGEAELESWDDVLNKYITIGQSDEQLLFGSNQVRGILT